MSTNRVDPYRGYNFRIELDNTTVASFREASGLTASRDAVVYREGTDIPLTNRQLTGLCKFTNIVLKRGYTSNRDLWNWYKNILNGVPDRRNGAIILQDEQHNDVLRWNFENGWITKWESGVMNATAGEVFVETIEIIHEGLGLA